jgi:hypothetical protein
MTVKTRICQQSQPKWLRQGVAIAAAAAIGIGVTMSAGVSGASTASHSQTIHLFSKAESFTYTTAAGKVVKQPPAKPHVGDYVEATNQDYVGSATDHAKNWTDTDHEMCVFTSSHGGTCYGEIAIGGSMILAKGGLSPSPNDKLVVYGGSGAYQGVTGTADAVDLHPHSPTSPSELTLKLHLH